MVEWSEEKINEIINNNKRIDVGKKYILNCLLYNNRFKYYDLYLKLAQKKDYFITSYINFISKNNKLNKKTMILRHDVDRSPKNARRMFEIEKKNEVKATYYFRWSTLDKELISDMIKADFEVGLHYETLGRYCEKNDIDEMSDLVLNSSKKILKREIKKFKKITGANIKTVAAHGHSKNKELGIPNNRLLENEDYQEFGIVNGAYDKNFYKEYVTAHIMDSGILNNYGFAYDKNPIDSILDEEKVIVFLAHPVHWQFSFKYRLFKLFMFCLGNYSTNSKKSFKRI